MEAGPDSLRDAAKLILETGLRVGETGYRRVRAGKSKSAGRNTSLAADALAMLKARPATASGEWVSPSDSSDKPFVNSSLGHRHSRMRDAPERPAEFVIHSLRHTMLTRLGEYGADAFTTMRIAGHLSVVVFQGYVHPTPESLERAFKRFETLNSGSLKVRSGRRTSRKSASVEAISQGA